MLEVLAKHWGIALASSFVLGISKSGIKGFGVLVITLMALIFGTKSSTGIVLPLLIVGDILAIIWYTKHVDWKILKKILPYVLLGVGIGAFLGKEISEVFFRRSMAVLIVVSILSLVVLEISKKKISNRIRFIESTGVLAGITTMIGNLSGAVINFLFLALQLEKYSFIGTAAMLYFLVNLSKLPFHIWYWKTITIETLKVNLFLIPLLVLGFFTGKFLVKKIKNTHYRNYIIVISIIGAIILFLKN